MDYTHDGRVLVEALRPDAMPAALRSPLVTRLGQVYEQLNAPFGAFGEDTLTASTRAHNSGSATDDSRYVRIEARIQALTETRNTLARQIASDLDGAAFADRPVPPIRAILENAQAHILIAEARALAHGMS